MDAEAPWTVEVTRGDLVESVHRVSVVVLGPDGTTTLQAGPGEAVYARSALKPAQAVASLEAGADLSGAEVALAAGSHSGEAVHVDAVAALLTRLGLDAGALGCPPDLPLGRDAVQARLASGAGPSRLAMNCSGKHAAMLAACHAAGWPPDTYLDPAHPMQVAARAAVEGLAGPVRGASVDGCGAPAFVTDLPAVAHLMWRFAHAGPGTVEHRVAAAMRAHPDLVAGTGRLDTVLMRELPGTLCKTGAEGVLAGALPDGSAFVLKVHDGAARAVGPVVLELLDRAGCTVGSAVRAVTVPPITGGGRPVGDQRVRV